MTGPLDGPILAVTIGVMQPPRSTPPCGRLRGFFKDRSGAAAILFGLMFLPAMLLTGMTLDYARALKTRERLTHAIDAAALAAASWPDLTEDEVKQKVKTFFDANLSAQDLALGAQPQITVGENTITVTVSTNVPTTFLQIAGVKDIAVVSTSEVTKKSRHIELVMALDNTGSMAYNSKISSLKTASKKLVDILFQDKTSFPNGEVKIGLVPFSAAVNIGPDKLASGWIDTTASSSIAKEDFSSSGTNPLTLYDKLKNREWAGCVRARNEPYDTLDTAPASGTPDTLWLPYFAPDEPDPGYSYANDYLDDGNYGGSYYDYDKRQRYTGKYNNKYVNSSSKGPDFNCPLQPVLPLTSTKATLTSALDAMQAKGSTVIPAGLAWAWRLISPTPPFTEGAAYDDDKVIKAIILLTDGQNDVGGGLSNHNKSYYSAYGYATSGHLGSTSGYQAESVLDSKTATLCTNIKAKGVLLYTITFQLNDGPIKDLMRNCATEPKMYFDSPSNDELGKIFTNIAQGLSELRISK